MKTEITKTEKELLNEVKSSYKSNKKEHLSHINIVKDVNISMILNNKTFNCGNFSLTFFK